jgi:protein MpaA
LVIENSSEVLDSRLMAYVKGLLKSGMGSGNLLTILLVCLTSLNLSRAAVPSPVASDLVPVPIHSIGLNSDVIQMQNWCAEASRSIASLKWKIDPCTNIQWQIGGKSSQGRALVFADFGDKNSENTTLVLSTVHGDEVTPLYIAIQLAHWLNDHQAELEKTRVIVAPLINPDGFFHFPRTRMNARGVDINRNFRTKDWQKRALAAWKLRFRKDPRRFPGVESRSESETLFQEELIHRIKPQKILSIHSPLNHLDYDGPSPLSLSQFSMEYRQSCEKLKKSLNAKSSGYFPGSLGNYAGRELGIPTITLELPTAKPEKAAEYWKKFTHGISTMIHFAVPSSIAGNQSLKAGG